MLSVTGLQTLSGTNRSELALPVLFHKWEMRGAQAKDSQPHGQPT